MREAIKIKDEKVNTRATPPKLATQNRFIGLLIPLSLLALTMLLTCCHDDYAANKSSLQAIVDRSPLETPLPQQQIPHHNDQDLVKLSRLAPAVAYIKMSNGWTCSGFYIGNQAGFAIIHTARFCNLQLYLPGPLTIADLFLGYNQGQYFNRSSLCKFIRYPTSESQQSRYNLATLSCPIDSFERPHDMPNPIPVVYEDDPEMAGRIGWDGIDCQQSPEVCPPGVDTWDAPSQSVLMGMNMQLQTHTLPSIFISRTWPSVNRTGMAKSIFQGEGCRIFYKENRFITHGPYRYPAEVGTFFNAYLTSCSTPGIGSSGGVALMEFDGVYKAVGVISGEWTVEGNDHGEANEAYDHNILSAIPSWAKL